MFACFIFLGNLQSSGVQRSCYVIFAEEVDFVEHLAPLLPIVTLQQWHHPNADVGTSCNRCTAPRWTCHWGGGCSLCNPGWPVTRYVDHRDPPTPLPRRCWSYRHTQPCPADWDADLVAGYAGKRREQRVIPSSQFGCELSFSLAWYVQGALLFTTCPDLRMPQSTAFLDLYKILVIHRPVSYMYIISNM